MASAGVDFEFNQIQESLACRICNKDLSRKRTLALECGHVYHRTCLLEICESDNIDGDKFVCPSCEVPITFEKNVFDERGRQLLTEVIGFGPGAQPTEYIVVRNLEDLPRRRFFMDTLMRITSEWLCDVSMNLEQSRLLEREEYLQDLVHERAKLIIRLQIIAKLQDKQITVENRINSARKVPCSHMQTVISKTEISYGPSDINNAAACIITEGLANKINSVAEAPANDVDLTTTEGVKRYNDATCLICLEPLSRKRTLTLECGHIFHRTCLLEVHESANIDGNKFQCPTCNILFLFEKKVLDMRSRELLSEVVGFGPGAQPAEYIVVRNLENPRRRFFMDTLMRITSEWLLEVSMNLEQSRLQEGTTEKFLQDLVDERTKLLTRLKIIAKLQEIQTNVENRINSAREESRSPIKTVFRVAIPSESSEINNVTADFSSEGATSQENAVTTASANDFHLTISDSVDSNADATCSICLESLSRKRSATNIPCNHKFHQTCVLNWIESNGKIHTCCVCRQVVTRAINVENKELFDTYPFEVKYESMIKDATMLRPKVKEIVRKCLHSCTNCTWNIFREKRRAIREGKDNDWMSDIDEEIEKMIKRYGAAVKYYLYMIEKLEIEKLQAAADSTEIINAASLNAGHDYASDEHSGSSTNHTSPMIETEDATTDSSSIPDVSTSTSSSQSTDNGSVVQAKIRRLE